MWTTRAGVRGAVTLGLAVALCPTVQAMQKVDEGFSSAIQEEGGFYKPTDSISKGVMGKNVIYWTEWHNEDPSHQTKWRCLITYRDQSDPIYDKTFVTPDPRSEGHTLCGLDTSDGGLFEGTYHFTIYADDQEFGDGTIAIEKTFLSRFSPTTLFLGAMALVILGAGWMRKKNAS